ncbi:MAG: hypothetical protein KIT09_35800, partial [Bryobacteraceae bacterium]|nr:hypothetical protein [Bryobacteraceae bacterium]
KANASIKSVNTGLSNIEATAAKSARGAAQGIDGMTAAMVKGATAGNLLADAIKIALAWAKDFTVGSIRLAAENAKAEASLKALAKAHGLSGAAAAKQVALIEEIGFEYTAAAHAVQRLIVADMELSKAEGLAKLAKDAAAIQNVAPGQALEALMLAIESGASRGLRTMGLFVDFQKEITLQELKLGRALTETEEKQVRYNAVMREGAKIQGAHAAVAQTVETQLVDLRREFNNLREDIGAKFQDDVKALIGNLRGLVGWLRENSDLLVKFGQAALWVSGVLATYALADKIMALAKSIAALNLASLNPYALLGAGVLAAGAVVYSNWKDTEKQLQERANDLERQALREDLLKGRTKIEDLRKKGMTDDQIRELVGGRRALGGEQFDLSGLPKVSMQTGADAEIEALKMAAAVRKRQAEATREAQRAAAEAAAKEKTGFARDMAEMNAQIAKWTTFTDDKGVERRIRLTRDAWNAVLDQLTARWTAFKQKLLEDNRQHVAEYMKAEEEAIGRRMAFETELYEARLQYNEEIVRRDLDHSERMLGVEEQRAGIERDARLRGVEAGEARTIQQKVTVEQQKAEIEIDYLERVHEIKMRLFDLETSRMVLEEEAHLARLGYRAGEISARIAELSRQREEIRQANQEATDASIRSARESAAIRSAEMIRDHNRQVFDSFKRQAEGVFDALLAKSQSIWSAMGNSLKTALLTAIKEVVTSRVAAMLMQLFGGGRASFAGAGGGGWAGVLGAAPALAGFGIPGAPGGTGGFSGPVAMGGSGASGGGAWANVGAMGANLKEFAGIGGSVQTGAGMATTWQAATMGQKLSAIGNSNAALLGGGLLLYEGLRRGGASGLAMSTAGGAMIGFKFGGPIGAAIGAAAGATAGIVRLFIKGADEKIREEVRAVYGVSIDKQFARELNRQRGKMDIRAFVRSPQVREQIELYAEMTGQRRGMSDDRPRGVNLVQQGGAVFQDAVWRGNQAFGYASSLPSLGGQTLERMSAPSQQQTQITLQLDGPATVDLMEGKAVKVISSRPRLVQSSYAQAMKSSAGRRQSAANAMNPLETVAV